MNSAIIYWIAAVMACSFFYTATTSVFIFVWGASTLFDTYRALRQFYSNGRSIGVMTRRRAMREALMNWVILVIAQYTNQAHLDRLVSWFPFYTTFKVLAMGGFLYQRSLISQMVYTSYLRKYLKPYEIHIDLAVDLVSAALSLILHFTVEVPLYTVKSLTYSFLGWRMSTDLTESTQPIETPPGTELILISSESEEEQPTHRSSRHSTSPLPSAMARSGRPAKVSPVRFAIPLESVSTFESTSPILSRAQLLYAPLKSSYPSPVANLRAGVSSQRSAKHARDISDSDSPDNEDRVRRLKVAHDPFVQSKHVGSSQRMASGPSAKPTTSTKAPTRQVVSSSSTIPGSLTSLALASKDHMNERGAAPIIKRSHTARLAVRPYPKTSPRRAERALPPSSTIASRPAAKAVARKFPSSSTSIFADPPSSRSVPLAGPSRPVASSSLYPTTRTKVAIPSGRELSRSRAIVGTTRDSSSALGSKAPNRIKVPSGTSSIHAEGSKKGPSKSLTSTSLSGTTHAHSTAATNSQENAYFHHPVERTSRSRSTAPSPPPRLPGQPILHRRLRELVNSSRMMPVRDNQTPTIPAPAVVLPGHSPILESELAGVKTAKRTIDEMGPLEVSRHRAEGLA